MQDARIHSQSLAHLNSTDSEIVECFLVGFTLAVCLGEIQEELSRQLADESPASQLNGPVIGVVAVALMFVCVALASVPVSASLAENLSFKNGLAETAADSKPV